jgi:hypothetical protein
MKGRQFYLIKQIHPLKIYTITSLVPRLQLSFVDTAWPTTNGLFESQSNSAVYQSAWGQRYPIAYIYKLYIMDSLALPCFTSKFGHYACNVTYSHDFTPIYLTKVTRGQPAMMVSSYLVLLKRLTLNLYLPEKT